MVTFTRRCLSLLFLATVGLTWSSWAEASEEVGTISSSHAYAWAENLGWINLAPVSGGVTVRDDKLNGYAWSQNFGWINFAPPTAGVTNNREGDLAGYAWSQNFGWINFNGVAIDTGGLFSGDAIILLDNSRIRFNCATECGAYNFSVTTDWRPVSVRPSPSAGSYNRPPGRSTPIPALPTPDLPTELPPACSNRADLNCDGQVNLKDFSVFLALGPRTGPNPADLNNDNQVNSRDLSMLLASWTQRFFAFSPEPASIIGVADLKIPVSPTTNLLSLPTRLGAAAGLIRPNLTPTELSNKPVWWLTKLNNLVESVLQAIFNPLIRLLQWII